MGIQRRHVVVIPREDCGIEIHPMKEWLKQHQDRMPPNLDPDPANSTSHEIRRQLRKLGWTMEESPTEVRLLAPGTEPPEEDGEEEEEQEESAAFSLESQLRDFLADNLSTVKIDGRQLDSL